MQTIAHESVTRQKIKHTWYKVESAILQSSSPVRPLSRLRLNLT